MPPITRSADTSGITVLTLVAALAVLAVSTAPALAQSDLLKGPAIPTQTQNTIGSTDMNGYFTPVEGRPELAAFALVTNDPEKLASARDLDHKRIFDLAAYLVDEIDTVREITDALDTGNETQAQLLLAQLRLRYDPSLSRDPLLPELEKMLDADQRAELTRILDDYWLRWAQSQTNTMRMEPDSSAYKKTEHQLNNQLFQEDIRQAYDASLKRYRDTIDAIVTAIQPTEDQQAQIRELIINHIKETKLKATNAQRQALMLDIYHLLDEDRQEQLFLLMTSIAIGRSG